MKHIYLSRENVSRIGRVLSRHINTLPRIRRGYPDQCCCGYYARLYSMRGDSSLNPARETTFSFISVRD